MKKDREKRDLYNMKLQKRPRPTKSKRLLQALFRAATHAFLPHYCAHCQKAFSEAGKHLCPRCQTRLLYEKHGCPHHSSGELKKLQTINHSLFFSHFYYCFKYSGPRQTLFRLAKFQENPGAWREIIRLALAKLPPELFEGSILLPAPSSNPFAEKFCHKISKRWKIPVENVFQKNSQVQSKGLARPQRYMAVHKGVSLEPAALDEASVSSFERIILVDDIYTTGATLNQCARLLSEQGIPEEKIYLLTLFLTVRDHKTEPDDIG